MKKKLLKLTMAAAIALPILGASVGSASAQSVSGTITMKGDVYLRAGDSFSAPIIRVLPKGSKWKVYEQSNGLYSLGGNQWTSASTKYATFSPSSPIVSTASTSTLSTSGSITTKGNVNVRSDASFTSRIVKTLNSNTTVKVYEQKNGLYKLGEGQWITANSQYVTFSKDGVSNPPTTTTAPITSTASKYTNLIAFAKQYMGVPYVWGGTTPRGFDCSGFVYYVLKNNGYNISRLDTIGLWNKFPATTNPQPGDLIFLKGTYRTGISHVGFYLGNGQYLNAGDNGITISNLNSNYYKAHFAGYRSIH